MPPPPAGQQNALSLAGLLAAFSQALDITEGQPMGHAVRSALIGLQIGEALSLSKAQMSDLLHVLLLKDAGCSSNAARMCSIFGCDDTTAKRDAKISDWTRLSEAVKYGVTHTMPDAPLWQRLQKMREMLKIPGRVMDIVTATRCERGANVARRLQLGESVAEGIYHLDEHWDGQGAPHGKQRDEIPLLARIACLAQTLEVYSQTYDVTTAYRIARKRTGKWFDPTVVAAAHTFAQDSEFWHCVREMPRLLFDVTTHPLLFERPANATMDDVCSAFAEIVDAKSSFTGEHSTRVCQYADEIAATLGYTGEHKELVHRAALLHDLGKLGVSNLILDKPDRLTESEFAIIKKHPYHTRLILQEVEGFDTLAEIAATHHEKLDGSGYDGGRTGDQLTQEMRILTVADIFDALTAERPYRAAMPLEKVFAILDKESGVTLDAECVAALKFRYA